MASADNFPFYNHLGQIEYLPGYPLSFGDWSSSTGAPFPAEQQTLIDDVSRILQKSPIESHVRAEGTNLTLEVVFEDRSEVIARKVIQEDDGVDLGNGPQKLGIEGHLLQWLGESTKIPIPRILSPLDDQHSNLIVMNKLPGTMLLNAYSTFDTPAKERLVEEYARVALDLFSLDVPQRIGTLVPSTPSGPLDVIPLVALDFRAVEVFEDIRQYLDFLFEKRKTSSLFAGDDGGYIDELKRYTDNILTDLLSHPNAPSLLRCTLVHEDLHDMNILVGQNGHITGIVDWEYQAVHPAVLAAGYPPWLSYGGTNDPRFVNNRQTFWLDSPQESERLRDLYSKIIKSRNYHYWEALVLGTQLRSCLGWLLDTRSDPGCKRMKKWMDATFSASE